MNIDAQFAEIERIIKEYGFSQSPPVQTAENIERKEMIFVVSDNTSQPTTDFARYAELASNS